MTDLSNRVRHLTEQQRELLRPRLLERGPAAYALLGDGEHAGHAPVSLGQRRLLFLSGLVPESSHYHVPFACRLTGRLDVAALRASLTAISARHEVLRTVFPVVDGEHVQRVLPAEPVPFPVVDLRRIPAVEHDAVIRRLLATALRQPFDLERGPLVRSWLLSLSEREAVLVMVGHHVVFDGWSASVLGRELSELYQTFAHGREPSRPPLPVQFADYARWQRHWIDSEAARRQLAFWADQLRGAPQSLTLPLDRPRPAAQSHRGATHTFMVGPELRDGLRRLGRQHGATTFMVLLAVFQVVLARYSRQTDVLVGTPIADRRHQELTGLIGFFANTAVIRGFPRGDRPFTDFLAEIKQVCLGVYDNQDVPLDEIARRVFPERDLGRNPLHQVLLALHNTPDTALRMADVVATPIEFENVASRFDLDLNIWETADGLECRAAYATDLFDESTVARIARSFVTVATAVVADPTRRIAELPVMPAAEFERVVYGWNATTTARTERCLHQLVESQVRRTPAAVAVSSADSQLSYEELDRRANDFAHLLRGRGVRCGTRVAIQLPRRPELVVAILAVLKTGAAYVPLDPTNPPSRLATIIDDSQCELVVTEADFHGTSDSNTHESPPTTEVSGDDLAYLIYTSGSTGTPKGTMVSHRSVVNYLLWAKDTYRIGDGSGVPVLTSLSFDLTVTSLFGPLLAGQTLVLPPEAEVPGEQLRTCVRDAKDLSLVKLTPTHLSLVDHEDLPDGPAGWTRTLVIGGEALYEDAITWWRDGVRIFNEYGPTEATVACAAHLVTSPVTGFGRVPIGRPIHNTRIYVLDQAGHPVAVGVPGELYVGGAGVAQGYWRRPGLTAERFVPDPFGTERGGRLYRTGDLVRYLPNGDLEYLGRVDRQVKIRGHRVELAEIEALASGLEQVRHCAVVAHERAGADTELVAFHCLDGPRVRGTGVEADRVAEWRMLYDRTYHEAMRDERRDELVGWDSSYTGKRIDPAQMRHWQDSTADRILRWAPERVLEIGCGTGLVLTKVAPAVTFYKGTDLSAETVRALEKTIDQPTVVLETAPAHDSVQPGDSFDMVVLNSVVQYFPSLDYLLDVLDRALAAVRTGGHVFLGDLRSLPLLEPFHTSVQARRLGVGDRAAELSTLVFSAMADERELCLDPRLFRELRQRWPRITDVRVMLKRGRHHNELTSYRYDVLLTVDGPEPSVVPEWLDWHADSLDIPRLRAVLGRSDAVGVSGVPNARLVRTVALSELRKSGHEAMSVGELLDRAETSAPAGVEPEDLWQLGADTSHEVTVSWSAGRPDGSFDVVFWKTGTPAAASPPTTTGAMSWQRYANDPLWRTVRAAGLSAVKDHLIKNLPAHMVPARHVLLPDMPLGASGKIDYGMLSRLAAARAEDTDGHSVNRPLTDTERAVAAVWCELLNRGEVSPNDDFFALGGHSLLTFQLVLRLRKLFDVDVAPVMPFEQRRLAEMASHIDQLRATATPAAVETSSALPTLVRAERLAQVPLSFAQQRLWFLQELDPGSSQYNCPVYTVIRGTLDVPLLERCLAEVARRHEVLRTVFVARDGVPHQVVLPPTDVVVPVADLIPVEPTERAALARQVVEREFTRPFELDRQPHWRVLLVRSGRDEHLLLLTIHHVAFDGWSQGVLVNEIASLYEAFRDARPSPLPEPPVQYADYAIWQRELSVAGRFDESVAYWRRQLDGILDLPRLPQDSPASGEPGAARSLPFVLAPETASGVRELCQSEQCTPYMVLLAALYTTMSWHSGTDDLVVAADVANRSDRNVERLIGYFVNQVLLRVRLAGVTTWRDLLRQVRDTTLAAYTHQDLPFDHVVQAVNPRRSRYEQPLFQVKFGYDNTPQVDRSVSGLTFEAFDHNHELVPVRSDLALLMSEDGARMSGIWTYDSARYTGRTMAAWSRFYLGALDELLHTPDGPLSIEGRT